MLNLASSIAQCCDQGTSPRDRGTKVRGQDRGEAVAYETEAADPETEAKAARQLIGIGYSIPINPIQYSFIRKMT